MHINGENCNRTNKIGYKRLVGYISSSALNNFVVDAKK